MKAKQQTLAGIDFGIVPVDKAISIEPLDHLREANYAHVSATIIHAVSRKKPHNDVFILWMHYKRPIREQLATIKGYQCVFGVHPNEDWVREWKTLKGIVQFIEKEYGQLIL